MSRNVLDNRATSGFPLSVGTGLALESIFEPTQDVIDPDRDVSKLKLKKPENYSLFIFNIETLIRNIINSVPSEDFPKIRKENLYETLIQEMSFMFWLFNQNKYKLEFYINTYKNFKDRYKERLRQPAPGNQTLIKEMNDYCIDRIRREDKDKVIKVFDVTIRYKSTDVVLMMSHIPADLLSHSKFVSLSLLESHTGAVKTQKDFNTKYWKIPREDMSFLPFDEYLLVIFGDKVMFSPHPIKKRLEVYNHMKTKGVLPVIQSYI